MSTVQEIKAAIPTLEPKELADLKKWIDDFFEDQCELSDEVKAKLDQSRAEIASPQYRTRQPCLTYFFRVERSCIQKMS